MSGCGPCSGGDDTSPHHDCAIQGHAHAAGALEAKAASECNIVRVLAIILANIAAQTPCHKIPWTSHKLQLNVRLAPNPHAAEERW